MRDDFPQPVKDTLARRVASRCSNPACRKPTSGPQDDPAKSVNIGVAAHITAASSDGPRYNGQLSSDERRSPSNGLWLCQSCAKLVDNDDGHYTVGILHRWKAINESAALRSIEGTSQGNDDEVLFFRLEQLMPDLLEEMRKDLAQFPLRRKFVPLQKQWGYLYSGDEFSYYYDDHPELESKLVILENYNLIRFVPIYSNAKHYVLTEALVRYLGF